MSDSEQLLTIADAARMLGVSKLTLRNWDNNGRLKAVRIGTRSDRRYRKSDIDAHVAAGSAASSGINRTELQSFLSKNTLWFERAPGFPLTLEVGAKKLVEVHEHVLPGFTNSIFLFEDEQWNQILSIEESTAICRKQLDDLRSESESIQKFITACRKQFAALDVTFIRSVFSELGELSDAELNTKFLEFIDELGTFWVPTLVIEAWNPFLDRVYLPDFVKKNGNEQNAREAFALITAPRTLSFVSQERRDFLRIIAKYLSSSRERVLLEKSDDAEYLTHLALDNPAFLQSLRNHQQEYFWVQNSYAGRQILSISMFLTFIRETVRHQSMEDLRDELASFERHHDLAKQQRQRENDLELSAEIKKELEFIRTILEFKDARRKFIAKMIHVLFSFVEEYSKRSNVPSSLLVYALGEEMPSILAKDFDIATLARRVSGAFLITQKGGRASFLEGNESISLRRELEAMFNIADEHTAGLRGDIANKGTNAIITGVVRVLFDPRDEDIREDEILVTYMPRSEFVPIIRKARAMITDEGGLTSYAAIVSRELNKPCIIGTRGATKILKTGDTIEMTMETGSIRIL